MKKTIADYKVDPEKGIVFGQTGKPITKKANGYVHVWNRNEFTDVSISAHRLIWERVNGEIPKGLVINHINGIKDDNRIVNLEVVTASENTKHAYMMGLRSAAGEKNGRAIGKARRLHK